MTIIDSLITDRSASDIPKAIAIRDKYAALGDWSALSQEELNTLERGFYTRHSLNRVESACAFIADLRGSIGFPVSLSVKTNWSPSDYFTPADLSRFLNNLKALQKDFFLLPSTPPVPSDIRPFSNANDIERILVDLNAVCEGYIRSSQHIPFSGNLFSGEVIAL